MGNLGFQELLLIAIVILVLFGSRKIPEFMRGLGKGIREFNNAKDNVKRELEEGMQEKDQQVKPSTNATPPVNTVPPVTTAPPVAAATPETKTVSEEPVAEKQ